MKNIGLATIVLLWLLFNVVIRFSTMLEEENKTIYTNEYVYWTVRWSELYKGNHWWQANLKNGQAWCVPPCLKISKTESGEGVMMSIRQNYCTDKEYEEGTIMYFGGCE